MHVGTKLYVTFSKRAWLCHSTRLQQVTSISTVALVDPITHDASAALCRMLLPFPSLDSHNLRMDSLARYAMHLLRA